jgi:hypothetical protein
MDTELDMIAGGVPLNGLDLLSDAMGGSKVLNNLSFLFEFYQNRG